MILKNHCLQNTSAFCSPSAIVINVYKIICEINFTQSMQNMNRCTTKQIYRNHTFEKLIFDTINVSVVETNEIFKENKSSKCSSQKPVFCYSIRYLSWSNGPPSYVCYNIRPVNQKKAVVIFQNLKTKARNRSFS